MKQTTLFLLNTVKRPAKKAVLSLLLVAGLYSQAANAQDRREGGERGGPPNRQNAVHQNAGRNNDVRPMTRPANTSINRTNTTVNRTNTTINRTPVNRTNVTINRSNTNINRPSPANRTAGNRTYTSNRTVNNRVTVNRTNNNYRAPVYNARNPSWRYSNMPRRNSVIVRVPATYRTINYGGYGYRYHNGIFYRPYNNSFIVTAPPIGLFIDVLPIGYRRIYVNNYPYYYYDGTYYDYRNNNYTVVSPPVGAVVESIPDGYQTVVIDGETYYTVDGAQYKPVVQDNGEIWYEVIKAN